VPDTTIYIHTDTTIYIHTSTQPGRERVLFIGTQFSNLYTAVDTPARGRVGVCVVFVCLVFVCMYVLGHSWVSQPLNLRLCLLRHLDFLTPPHASPTCRRRRLNSYRLLRRLFKLWGSWKPSILGGWSDYSPYPTYQDYVLGATHRHSWAGRLFFA
jgi:hypothetical protein